MATTSYVLGLGANRRTRHGSPARTLLAALDALGLEVVARSRILSTVAVGPGRRHFANMAVVTRSELAPPALLRLAKATERAFGRRPGRRWGDRPLDVDLLLWSGGGRRSRDLRLPHAGLAHRRFVLDPLIEIAPLWRVGGGMTVRHLHARLTRPRPLHRSQAAPRACSSVGRATDF